MKIAVVDDNEAMGRSLCRMLETDNYAADYFISGVSLLQNNVGQYDVLLIDYYLPDTLGVSLIKEIKRMNVDSTIITMSVESDKQIDSLVKSAGVHFNLQKPFKYEALRNTIKHAEINRNIVQEFSKAGYRSKNILLITNGSNLKLNNISEDWVTNEDYPFELEGKGGVFYLDLQKTETLYSFLEYFINKKLFLLDSKYVIKIKPRLEIVEKETKEKVKIRNILNAYAFIVEM